MGIFGRKHGQANDWHKSVDRIAAGKLPLTADASPNTSFPWTLLRVETETYLKRKGKMSTEQIDERLIDLIKSHALKSIAVAACGHAISPARFVTLLSTDLQPPLESSDDLGTFLQILAASSRVNERVVSAGHEIWSSALLPFAGSVYSWPPLSDQCKSFQAFFELSMVSIPPRFLSLAHVEQIIQKASSIFSRALARLIYDGKWIHAYRSSRWLSRLPQTLQEGFFASIELWHTLFHALTRGFPTWRAWAAWHPVADRLRVWETLTTGQRSTLRGLIALEGPDLTGNLVGSLRQGLVARAATPDVNNIYRLEINSTSFVGEFSAAVPTVVTIKAEGNQLLTTLVSQLMVELTEAAKIGADSLALFIHLCNEKPVKHDDLRLLEAARLAANPLLSQTLLYMLKAPSAMGFEQRSILTTLLPELSKPRSQYIRHLLLPRINLGVTNCMEALRSKLKDMLFMNGDWNGTELVIQAFGQHVRDSPWHVPQMDREVQLVLEDWPRDTLVSSLQQIREASLWTTPTGFLSSQMTSLTKAIDEYCSHRLLVQLPSPNPRIRLVEKVISIWDLNQDRRRRELCVWLTENMASEPQGPEWLCLDGLADLSDGALSNIRIILEDDAKETVSACQRFARIHASSAVADSWLKLLRARLETCAESIFDWAQVNLPAESWIGLIESVGLIYWDKSVNAVADLPLSTECPPLLRPSLYDWASMLRTYLPIITSFEQSMTAWPSDALRCILTSHEVPVGDDILFMLNTIAATLGDQHLPILFEVLGRLAINGHNSLAVSAALAAIAKASPDALERCKTMLKMDIKGQRPLLQAMSATWLLKPEVPVATADSEVIAAMQRVLDIPSGSTNLPKEALDAASTLFEDKVAQLIEEAARLDALRLALKIRDPQGISELLSGLGIEEQCPADDILAGMPSRLLDVVERVGDNELEMHFPLSELKPLQRLGMGVGTVKTLVLHLKLADAWKLSFLRTSLHENRTIFAFCVHRESDISDSETKRSQMPGSWSDPSPSTASSAQGDTDGHAWRLVSDMGKPTIDRACSGQVNRTTYQLTNLLLHHFLKFESLENTYDFVTNALKNITTHCIGCNRRPQNPVRLHRSAACSVQCSLEFRKAHLAIRLAEIKHDPDVVDLLLTSVHCAALKAKPELLPGCPITDLGRVITALKLLPSMSEMTRSSLRLGASLQQVLTWACYNYRGFLASATGLNKIPSMPNCRQFLLASTSPELEREFDKRLGNKIPLVVFHGTNLERLYAILCQGLKVCSGTSLQAHGAAYGNGIYCANEPSMALAYATASRKPDFTGWRYSSFDSVKVLLGLAYAGPTTTNGIHVVSDPNLLILRYIFICPVLFQAPIANHIRLAMQSMFASLRYGRV